MAKAKQLVVLDKNFLVGVSGMEFEQLSTNYNFLETECLIGECFQYVGHKDPKKHRQSVSALSKFSDKGHLLRRINTVQELLRLEIETRIPCWPADDYVTSSSYYNRAHLKNPNLLRPEHHEAIGRWQKYLANEVISQKQRRTIINSPVFISDQGFRQLRQKGMTTEDDLKTYAQKVLPSLRKLLGCDIEIIRSIYGSFRPFGHPLPEKIDRHWFLFRKVQIESLMHLDLVDAFLQSGHYPSDKNIAHDVLDYTYCLFAAQIGGLASSEKAQQDRFRLLSPNGILLWKDAQTGRIQVS